MHNNFKNYIIDYDNLHINDIIFIYNNFNILA